MQVSPSPMLGFRALQAIMDLRATAGRQPRSAIRGIAARILPADRARGADAQLLTRVILHQGGRLETDRDSCLLDALKLAASQPDADRDSFAAATAILLADRLQSGKGKDDLGWYWSSFRTQYVALDAHDRAAIVQGFVAGAALGQVRMTSPPPPMSRLTQRPETVSAALLSLARRDRDVLEAAIGDALGEPMAQLVLRHLRSLIEGASRERLTGDSPLFEPLLAMASIPSHRGHAGATALLLDEAVRSRDAEGWFAITLWPQTIGNWLSLDETEGRPILAGLRHLYEADETWVPMPDRRVDPRRMDGVSLLPVLDESYSGGRNGSRVG